MRQQDGKKALERVRCIGFSLFLISLALTGCSSSDSGPRHGIFNDSTVEGLTFKTETLAGETDSQGRFSYMPGETVTFSIGGIVLGTATAKSIITPVDLVAGAQNETDPTVTNITRLLITLDEDNDPDNGITISPEVRTALADSSVDFEQDTTLFAQDAEVLEVIKTLNLLYTGETVEPTLCTVQEAQDHLGKTIDALANSGYEHTSASGGNRGFGGGGGSGGGGCG
ncbi:MAG: hypothetical protein ABSC14_00235 [Desulfomonilia bacterium]|jgi:hypothetical protein